MSAAQCKPEPGNDEASRPAWQGRAADELDYIRTETDYISSVVRSSGGLLALADLERVIALTSVLERINQRMASGRP